MHQISIPSWVKDRAVIRLDRPQPRSTALVVVDMQIIFVEEGQRFAKQHCADILPNVNRLAAVIRDNGGVVVFTRHTAGDIHPYSLPRWQMEDSRIKDILYEPFLPDTRGHGLDERLDCRPGDIVIDKYRYSALTHNSSTLKATLEARGIDTIIIAGVATNCCCETTARDAAMLGYKTFFISDATSTLTDEEHNAALLSLGAIFADVRTTDEMVSLIQQ